MGKQVQVIKATKYLDEEDIIRVAAYCRVSTDSEDQINSFLAQMQYYNDYIRENDKMKLVDIYADEGITGTEMRKRDEFKRMLKDAKDGKIDRILVKSVFRFARNSLECIESVRTLKDSGVSVYFENDNIDTDKMNSEMMLYIKSAFAQSESLSHSRRMVTSVRMRMESGTYFSGSVPYGYKMVDRELVIVPKDAKKVKTIYRLYLSGLGMSAILKHMKRNETDGVAWTMGRISYILSNERYMGDFILHKTFTPNVFPLRNRPNRGEDAMYYCENANVPIISKEDFKTVQKIKEDRMKKFQREGNKKHFFTGKIRCRKCGWVYRLLSCSETELWGCSRSGLTIDVCHAPKFKTETFENAFVRMFNSLQENRKAVLEDTINLLQSLKVKCNLGNTAISEIDNDLSTLVTQNKAYADMFASGIVDQVTYSEKSDRIKRKIAELRSRRLKILNSDENEKCIEELRELKRILLNSPQAITEFDRELFNEIVDVMFIEQDGSIVFKVKGELELKVGR
ncbi:MAG: recombinase family protein [Clostridia bacterium]|nr:recombinase family protein [Clostridia bacterium]